MRLLVPLAAALIVCAFARNIPHKAHKRHVHRRANAEDEAVRALQDEELRAWEEDQRVRRQLASSDIAAAEKMRLAEEHWQNYNPQRRRGGCKGRYRPAPPGQARRRCPPRARTPHDRVATGEVSANQQQYPNSGYPYPYPNSGYPYTDNAAYEAERLEHEARIKQYEAERAALEAERAAYEQRYREAELKRAEEEERYRLALEERQREEEESARNRAEEERRHYELNDQRQREYEEILRKHREQHENESSRRRAPCPALRHDILDGKTYEQIFLFAHKSGCSKDETRMAIDMARRQRSEQYALKYAYPVLFFSRTRGWIKINNESERLHFEAQEAELDWERMAAQYQFVQEVEAARPHPHHPPAYTEDELEHSRKLAEAEKENFAVIDKDNNEAVSYGNDEEKPETVIDAIVLPQDNDEENEVAEEEAKAAPTKEELEEKDREEEEREEAAKEDEKDALVDAVLDEIQAQTDLKKAEEERLRLEEALEKEKAENARLAEELVKEEEEKERLAKELREKEEKEKAEAEALKAKEEEEAAKPVEKELPDEEEAVVEEEKKDEQPKEDPMEVKVEDPVPVVSDVGDEVVAEPAEKTEEVKEEEKKEENKDELTEGEEVKILDAVEPEPVAAATEEKKEVLKADGQALEFDPDEKLWE